MPRRGLEPPRLLHHQHLKLARLPIPPPGQVDPFDANRWGMEKIAEGLALGKPFEAIDSERAAGKRTPGLFPGPVRE